MLRYFAILLISCCFLACKKEQEEQLPASIQTLIRSAGTECTCLPYINKYRWKGNIVYVLAYKGPACNWAPSFYNSKGEPDITPAPLSFMDFYNEAKLIETVWECNPEKR